MKHLPDIILKILVIISIVIIFLYMLMFHLNNEPHKINGAGIEKVFIKEDI